MSQSQGIEVRRPSRRTIATGAAWAVPVIAVGASAPLAAASQNCVPDFQVDLEGSFKCCDGSTVDVNGLKNMKLRLRVVDVNNCLTSGDSVCVTDVALANGQPIGDIVFEGGQCTTEGGYITVYLLDVKSCTVNLLISFSVGINTGTVAIKSGNISSGNVAGDCQP